MSHTPITDALRGKHNIARMGCEDLFEQLKAFELELKHVREWYIAEFDPDPKGEGIDIVFPWDHL